MNAPPSNANPQCHEGTYICLCLSHSLSMSLSLSLSLTVSLSLSLSLSLIGPILIIFIPLTLPYMVKNTNTHLYGDILI